MKESTEGVGEGEETALCETGAMTALCEAAALRRASDLDTGGAVKEAAGEKEQAGWR